MDQTLIVWIIVCMSVVTYIPRLLPLLFLSGKRLHPFLSQWLKLVPAAVLPAILAPLLLIKDGEEFNLSFENLYFWTALLCFPLAWKFKSLSLPVILGMGVIATVRYLGW